MTNEEAIAQLKFDKDLYETENCRSGDGTPDGDLMFALDMAISALRAQEKEPCEYCLQGEDLAYGHDSMQRTGRIYIDGNLLTADLYSESMAVAVCCCPMCGKRLEVKP